MKLHQTLAILKGAAGEAHSQITLAHHNLMKTQLLAGLRKDYRAADEDDTVTYPSEHQKVTLRADQVIAEMIGSQIRAYDITASRDFTNMTAKADVIVDGTTFVQGAPVPFLLWLEKKLGELETFVKKLPTLDPSVNWSKHDVEGWASDPVETTKTKKVKKVLTLHPGNDKHAPQVQAIDEDVVQGYWTTVRYSGALQPADVNAMLKKVRKLQDAVKGAIAEANMTEAETPAVGKRIFDFVFADVVE